MIITTSYKPNDEIYKRLELIKNQLNVNFVERGELSIKKLMKEKQENELIVVENEYLKYYCSGSIASPVFFHPSMALLRINRLKQGDNDLMIQLCDLKKGDSFLDCTLGLASDAIVASYIVGSEGRVTGLESELVIATIAKDGLENQSYSDKDLNDAMRRIEIENIDHLEKLKSLPDNSYDIVYFDPMFKKGLKKSVSINPLRCVANKKSLEKEVIFQAKRVAKRRVVIKENTNSNEFERLEFKRVFRRRTFTYGLIEIEEAKDEK